MGETDGRVDNMEYILAFMLQCKDANQEEVVGVREGETCNGRIKQ